jgi:hypothetical protein
MQRDQTTNSTTTDAAKLGETVGTTFAARAFGRTPPPEDASVAPCPNCVKGWRRLFPGRRSPCLDCLGSGVQGYGFSALKIFEDWLQNPPDTKGTTTSSPRESR